MEGDQLVGKLTTLPVDDQTRWVTKADRAYDGLRRAILAGVLEPKEQINPKAVAAEWGMSVIPVREALRRLEQEGLVVIRPHIGAAVRELPVAELRENLLIRSELEALAARLATPRMTAEILERLRDLVGEMGQCIAAKRYDEFGALNRPFHMTAYDAIEERGLVRLIEQQWDQVPRAASVFAQQEHLQILDAFRRGDAGEAADLTREHKLRARTVQMTAFERFASEKAEATA
jgi:DNA-binding GntR family transcriptional regulator